MAKIYFLNHPDGEHSYGSATMGATIPIPWNHSRVHKRKFIQRQGEYLANGSIVSDTLYFWGEYEPYSEATIVSANQPKAVHDNLKPVLSLPPMPVNAQNSDPYVYGCFRNICCRRGKMKYQKGDILVFGTMNVESNSIEFDTVIVVEKLVPISSLSPNDQYFLASVKPIGKPKHDDFVEGAVFRGIENQYFSFVPCLPASTIADERAINAANTFKKPVLDLSAFGTQVHQSAYGKVCKSVSLRPCYWNAIVDAVRAHGLELGVSIDKI